MCITMPPAPVGRPPVAVPPTPPAPAPLPPVENPGIPPSPPAPPPSIVLDLVNSVVIAHSGEQKSFQRVLAYNGVLITVANGSGGGSYVLRCVLQNTGTVAQTASLQITALISSSLTLVNVSNPQTVTVPAENYTTVNTQVYAYTDGTVPVNISIGTTSITLPIAIYTLSP